MVIPSLLFFCMLATVIVLISGIVLMAMGGKLNKKYGNKLMVARISLQALAVILLGLTYFLSQSPH